jgi:ribosomal protein L16 Arg81 hydroxylase
MNLFENLIAPISIPEFANTYWQKTPLYLTGSSLSEILTMDEIDRFFAMPSMIYPHVKVIANGAELNKNNYSLNYVNDFNFLNKELVFDNFTKGNTLVIQAAHMHFRNLQAYTTALQNILNFEIHANVYITPSSAKGFHPHYDTHEVFVIQLFGSKNWNIYDIPVESPIKGWHISEAERNRYLKSKPTHQLTLNVGDVLYVPRGVVHDAFTSGDLSVHVTLGFHPPTRLGILKRLLEKAEGVPYFRKSHFSFSNTDSQDQLMFQQLVELWLEEKSTPIPKPKKKSIRRNTFLALLDIDNAKSIDDLLNLELAISSLTDVKKLSWGEAEVLKCFSGEDDIASKFSLEELKSLVKELVLKRVLQKKKKELAR